MKVSLFLASTIGGSLIVLLGTWGIGQLAPDASPALVLLCGLGLLLAVGCPTWWGFHRAFSGPGSAHHDLSELAWNAQTRAMTGRKLRTVGIVLAAAVLLSVIGFSLSRAGSPFGEAMESLSYYAQTAFMAAMFAAVIVASPLGTALRDATGASPARHKQISKVVFRNRDIPLDEDEQAGAARLAALAPVALPLVNLSSGYLYAALVIQGIRFAVADPGDVLNTVLLAALVITTLVYVPLLVRQVRRARRYARAHAALLVG